MHLGPLLEVILYVDDMPTAVAFYRDQLGLRLEYPHVDDYTDEHWVVFDTGSCKLCLHAGGTSHPGPDAPKVVFQVDDIRAAREALRARRVELSDIRSPAPGVSVCDGTDPAGNRFSIESHSRSE